MKCVDDAIILWREVRKRLLKEGAIPGYVSISKIVYPRWVNGEAMPIGMQHCPMCREFVAKDGNCRRCPFITVLNKTCASSGGFDFIISPSVQTCDFFIRVLESIKKEI